MKAKQQETEVYRITGARQGLTDDVRARQRRYVISMLVRTLSVVLTVLLWNVLWPLAVVTLVLGVALPYVAVVIANAGRENAPVAPATYVMPTTRAVLEPSVVETGAERGVQRPAGASGDPDDVSGNAPKDVPDLTADR